MKLAKFESITCWIIFQSTLFGRENLFDRKLKKHFKIHTSINQLRKSYLTHYRIKKSSPRLQIWLTMSKTLKSEISNYLPTEDLLRQRRIANFLWFFYGCWQWKFLENHMENYHFNKKVKSTQTEILRHGQPQQRYEKKWRQEKSTF